MAKAATISTPEAPAQAETITVMAKMPGTYPRPGETYPVYRSAGDVFTLNDAEHFAALWMRKLAPGEVAQLDPPPAPIPQTTAPRRAPQSPFPPLG